MPVFARNSKRIACTIAVAICGWTSVACADVQRVVSLYPCLDTILVHVADREQIAALSYYASDPRSSTIADIAKTLPMTYGTAEEIVSLRPDLVISSQYAPQKTHEALQRLGAKIALFDVPLTLAESIAQVRELARAVNRPERGEAVVANIEAALVAAAAPPNTPPISALVFQSNGFFAGQGVLIDELLGRTGFVNVAARYQLGQFGVVTLERMIADPPQALLSGVIEAGGLTWGDRLVSHPALARVAQGMARAELPERLLLCGGPVIPQTVAVLADARRRIASAAP